MKITDVEIYATNIDLGKLGWHPIIIRINTDAGIYGAGEVGLAYGVGAAAGVGMVRNLAESFLIGADLFKSSTCGTRCTRKLFGKTLEMFIPNFMSSPSVFSVIN